MDEPMISRTILASIYVNAFVVGVVLMGFEMLGSRYLYPYFGGGIGTWSSLISTVLCALALGYFAGGAIADKHPSAHVMGIAVATAAIYLSLVPATADFIMSLILDNIGDGACGVVLAATILLLIPLSLLGMLSPMIIRLLSRSTEESRARRRACLWNITLGNVFGTMFTTFVLIPSIGSRAITYLFAALLVVSAVRVCFSCHGSFPGDEKIHNRWVCAGSIGCLFSDWRESSTA